MTPSVIFIAVLGYLANLVQSISQEKQLQKENGWALIFKCLALGVPPFIVLAVLVDLFNLNVLSGDGKEIVLSYHLLILLVPLTLSLVFGYILSRNNTIEMAERFMQFLKEESCTEKPDGLLYSFFLHNVSNLGADGSLVHVTLNSRKSYVATLEHADLNVNLDPSEMTFSIIPVLSGYRRNDDLCVVYTADYSEQIEKLKDEIKGMSVEDPAYQKKIEEHKRIFKIVDIESIGLFNSTYAASSFQDIK